MSKKTLARAFFNPSDGKEGITDYNQAVNYIESVEKFGSVFGLETVRALLDRLGSPDKGMNFVHIAGTNGKGSVSCYITSVLIEAGYTVGTFNSPSVFSYNERYLLNGKPMDNDTVARLLTAVRAEREKIAAEGGNLPTAFELEFAVALLWFKERRCDAVVLETGLGGRLDATNAIKSKKLAVLTSIALDHTKILGDTVEKIAAEKVAIVKNCPLVTFDQGERIMSVLNRVKDLRIAEMPEALSDGLLGQEFIFEGKRFKISMLGEHQLQNAAVAIKSAEVLRKEGFDITDNALRDGMFKAKWAGRLELLDGKERFGKYVLLDGAHNPDGARVLENALERYFPNKKIALVYGMFADKDYEKVAEILCGGKYEIFTVTPPSARALDAEILAAVARKHCADVTAMGDVGEAVEKAVNCGCDVVCVCGSLSILSRARKKYEEMI